MSCTRPWNPPTYRYGSANATESGFRLLRRRQARHFYEVRLPHHAIIRRDLHQQPHDHELQLPYQYTQGMPNGALSLTVTGVLWLLSGVDAGLVDAELDVEWDEAAEVMPGVTDVASAPSRIFT